MRTTSLASMICAATLLAGCGGNGLRGNGSSGGDSASASAALDSSDSTTVESAMLVTTTDGIAVANADTAAASAGAHGVNSWYQPAGCVTAVTAGSTVTYTFANCSGPWGLVHVTGTADVTYSIKSDGVHAAISASALVVDGATLDLDADAVYSESGTTKQLAVTSTGSGTGLRGNDFTRKGSYTATWDTATMCGSLDGNWSTTVANDVWSTTVSGYRQCANACPTTGSIVYAGGLSKVTYSITFDGSAKAEWSTSTGFSGTVGLFCSGA